MEQVELVDNVQEDDQQSLDGHIREEVDVLYENQRGVANVEPLRNSQSNM